MKMATHLTTRKILCKMFNIFWVNGNDCKTRFAYSLQSYKLQIVLYQQRNIRNS